MLIKKKQSDSLLHGEWWVKEPGSEDGHIVFI